MFQSAREWKASSVLFAASLMGRKGKRVVLHERNYSEDIRMMIHAVAMVYWHARYLGKVFLHGYISLWTSISYLYMTERLKKACSSGCRQGRYINPSKISKDRNNNVNPEHVYCGGRTGEISSLTHWEGGLQSPVLH
jgi:putative hemolysin